MRELMGSDKYEYLFWGSHRAVEGIECFTGDGMVQIKELSVRRTRRGFAVSGMLGAVHKDSPDVLILIGNPNILQTWWAALFARIKGAKVLFWAHGWLRPEVWPKAVLRNVYYSLGDGVLVYGDRARVLAGESGFDPGRVYPIYNSLDWSLASELYERMSADTLSPSGGVGPEGRTPLLICTARLTPLCRFDLLLDAMALLRASGIELTLHLVGDGPEREALEAQARRLQLDVRFFGAIYDEQRLAELIYAADATVSPGKVGLTAVHSLSYGTPVVTHGDLDEQMPEVEAIIEGDTGAFFRRGDATDLARAIRSVLEWTRPRHEVRARCRAVIADRYTPKRQRELIEAVLAKVMSKTQ